MGAWFNSVLSLELSAVAASSFNPTPEINGHRITQLIRELNSENLSQARSAARQLGVVGKPAHRAIAALLIHASSTCACLRAEAVAAIGRIGEDANRCVPVLGKALGDPDTQVRRYAVAALGEYAFENTAPHLVRALRDEDSVVREFATDILGGQFSPATDWL